MMACGSPSGVSPPINAAERDRLESAMPRPPIEDGGHFASVVEGDVPIAAADYCDSFQKTPLEDILTVRTANIPRVTRTEPLRGTWWTPGARRRVVLEDGNSAVEEIIGRQCPGTFRYEVWNYTNDAGKYVKYAVGEFVVSPHQGATHVRWTYWFRPRGWPATWLLGSFVHGEYHDFMTQVFGIMSGKACAPLGSAQAL
jgi:hypothetical protein